MRIAAVCASLAFLAIPRATFAQVCHAPVAPEQPRARGVWLELRGEGATYATDDAHWQGLTFAAGWQSARLALRAALPTYRLVDHDSTDAGLGDASVEAIAALWRAEPLSIGAGALITAPTGDADAGLGMGHPMAAASLTASLRHRRVDAAITGSLAKALGGDEHAHHHHHDGTMPVRVDPMSPLEASATLRLGYHATPRLRPYLAGAAAFPLSDVGAERAAAGVGVTWSLAAAWVLGAELLVPITPDHEPVRATLGVSRWL